MNSIQRYPSFVETLKNGILKYIKIEKKSFLMLLLKLLTLR
jgi:hypothetical protein